MLVRINDCVNTPTSHQHQLTLNGLMAVINHFCIPSVCAAGHVRAAASTCLAYLACHPVGAKGDGCLWGPFRPKLLSVGTLGALLRAALTSSHDDPCNNIIQQTAAVGIMYLTTMVGSDASAAPVQPTLPPAAAPVRKALSVDKAMHTCKGQACIMYNLNCSRACSPAAHYIHNAGWCC